MWTYSHDKRQVIRIRDISPDVQIVDVSQVGRAWDSRRTVSSGVSGKRMLLPLCTSGVDQMSTHPPAVTPIPATSTATITSRDIDVAPGSSDPDPVPELGQPSNSLRHRCSDSRPLFLLRRWLGGDAGDSSVPLSPNRVQAGHSQDVPDESTHIAGFPGIFDEPVGCCSAVSAGWGTVGLNIFYFVTNRASPIQRR